MGDSLQPVGPKSHVPCFRSDPQTSIRAYPWHGGQPAAPRVADEPAEERVKGESLRGETERAEYKPATHAEEAVIPGDQLKQEQGRTGPDRDKQRRQPERFTRCWHTRSQLLPATQIEFKL